MNYDYPELLQLTLFELLLSDAHVQQITQNAIFDQLKSNQKLPDIYITIGHELTRNKSSITNRLSDVVFEISVYSKESGFFNAKKLASKIVNLINKSNLERPEYTVVGVWFSRSQTYRLENGNLRQIKLWFKALIEPFS